MDQLSALRNTHIHTRRWSQNDLLIEIRDRLVPKMSKTQIQRHRQHTRVRAHVHRHLLPLETKLSDENFTE